jgi:hypothetical protein
MSRRVLALAQVPFCSGARAVLKLLDYMIEEGHSAEVQKTIERHGRRIKRLQARNPGTRRH